MCIRDRAKREEYRRLQTVKGNIDQILRRERKPVKRPVSYTHLDVYKRQLEAADPLELAEIKRLWEPYINQLPDYAYPVSYTHLFPRAYEAVALISEPPFLFVYPKPTTT